MNREISQITDEVLALPVAERVLLAQKLWESVAGPGSPDPSDEAAALHDARKRDAELSTDGGKGRSHEQVMQAARKAIECD